MSEVTKLTAGGGPNPLYGKSCFEDTEYWKKFIKNCSDNDNEYNPECCIYMTCEFKNEWLKKYGYKLCPPENNQEPPFPHFGNVRSNVYYDNLYEQKMKNLKMGIL